MSNTDNTNNSLDSKVAFESNLKELEGVVRQLESGDISLDEMLALFENGVRLTRECTDALDKTEQKITILLNNKDTGEIEERPFTSAAGGQE